MKRTVSVLFCCAFLSASAAEADPVLFSAVLTGPAENPPNSSPALGIALVSYDPLQQTLGVLAGFTDLTFPSTVAHIHCCVDSPGTAAPATAVPTFPGFPTGVTSGFYSELFDLTDMSSFNPAFVAAAGGTPFAAELALAQGLAAGRAYFNVHSTQFSGGEIRGFFAEFARPAPIPEPASLLLVGTGLLGAWRVRRRHQRKP